MQIRFFEWIFQFQLSSKKIIILMLFYHEAKKQQTWILLLTNEDTVELLNPRSFIINDAASCSREPSNPFTDTPNRDKNNK